jgi:hypothetical protein
MDAVSALLALLGPLREALGLAKDVKDLMPSGEKRGKVERLVAEVDARLPAIEAQLAHELGLQSIRSHTSSIASEHRKPVR